MMSPLLHDALIAMAPNRSGESWLAGSTVLAYNIDRTPNDIDIHHLSSKAFERSVLQDTIALQANGYRWTSATESPGELEAVFTRRDGRLAVNWVIEPALPRGGLKADPRFGARASCREVVLRKLEMYEASGSSKHLRDLLQIRANFGAIPEPDEELAARLDAFYLLTCQETAGG